VLIYPYCRIHEDRFEYAVFKRADEGFWQGISGGGEDGESPLEAARREAFEEAGLAPDLDFLQLDTVDSIPVTFYRDSQLWGDDVYVVPQYCFGVRADHQVITLSWEHTEYCWLPYEEARARVKYDGSKTALWELDRRLSSRGPRGI
jgi:dihydroneopterin triphosphate diphosphatase